MKKFKQLWYYGLSIVGIPVVLIIMATFFVIASNLKTSVNKAIEEEEKPKEIDEDLKKILFPSR